LIFLLFKKNIASSSSSKQAEYGSAVSTTFSVNDRSVRLSKDGHHGDVRKTISAVGADQFDFYWLFYDKWQFCS